MSEDPRVCLAHILERADRIAAYVRDGQGVFLTDHKTQDAVIRNFEVIGEHPSQPLQSPPTSPIESQRSRGIMPGPTPARLCCVSALPRTIVYVLHSQTDSSKHYVGLTSDLARRLARHNAGLKVHTARG